MNFEIIAFDVANTILHKPNVYSIFNQVLLKNGFDISVSYIKKIHKETSEEIHFPDTTTKEFYNYFNRKVLDNLMVPSSEEIVSEIYNSIGKLEWEPFDDSRILHKLKTPLVIFSNFNSNLPLLLKQHFGSIFREIIVSETLGYSKPDPQFYEKAIKIVGADPAKILYIGDSMDLDINPAKALGIKTLLIDRDCNFQSYSERISSLEELSKIVS